MHPRLTARVEQTRPIPVLLWRDRGPLPNGRDCGDILWATLGVRIARAVHATVLAGAQSWISGPLERCSD